MLACAESKKLIGGNPKLTNTVRSRTPRRLTLDSLFPGLLYKSKFLLNNPGPRWDWLVGDQKSPKVVYWLHQFPLTNIRLLGPVSHVLGYVYLCSKYYSWDLLIRLKQFQANLLSRYLIACLHQTITMRTQSFPSLFSNDKIVATG